MKMMTTLFLLLALVLLPGQASAQSDDNFRLDFCSELGEMAATVLEIRDMGESPTAVLQVLRQVVAENASGDEELDAELFALYEAMVLDAYDLPTFRTPEMQMQQRAEFRSSVELWCLNAW